MKALIISLFSFAAVSTFAFECSQNEAQFIGKVVEYQKDRVDQNIFDCSFKIEFSQLNASQVCPLNEAEAFDARFEDVNCELKNGDFVSGYLVQDLKTSKISIE